MLRELRGACDPRQLRATRVHLRCVTSLGRSSIVYSKLYRVLAPLRRRVQALARSIRTGRVQAAIEQRRCRPWPWRLPQGRQ